MPLIGKEKTLIIACEEYGLNKFIEFNDRIFIYSPSRNMLQPYNHLERGIIQYYIESKGCKQLVFAGAVQQDIIDGIFQDDSVQSLHAKLTFNLGLFLKNRNNLVITTPLRDQLLTELHVIAQCNILMDYYFIREQVKNRQLQIRGVVAEMHEEQFKPIFYNGIIHNTIISMN